jgi:hypothetical protein
LRTLQVPVSILEVSAGRVSLEFASDEREVVFAAAKRRYGPAQHKWFVTDAQATFGEETFAFQDEWGEACLISLTTEGAAMLRTLASDLGV